MKSYTPELLKVGSAVPELLKAGSAATAGGSKNIPDLPSIVAKILKGSSIKKNYFIASQKAQDFMLKTTFIIIFENIFFFCIYTKIAAKI